MRSDGPGWDGMGWDGTGGRRRRACFGWMERWVGKSMGHCSATGRHSVGQGDERWPRTQRCGQRGAADVWFRHKLRPCLISPRYISVPCRSRLATLIYCAVVHHWRVLPGPAAQILLWPSAAPLSLPPSLFFQPGHRYRYHCHSHRQRRGGRRMRPSVAHGGEGCIRRAVACGPGARLPVTMASLSVSDAITVGGEDALRFLVCTPPSPSATCGGFASGRAVSPCSHE